MILSILTIITELLVQESGKRNFPKMMMTMTMMGGSSIEL